MVYSNWFRFLVAALLFPSLAGASESLDPDFNYFVDGNVVGYRAIQIGDEKNWSVPVVDLKGATESGKLVVSPGSFQREGDAIKAVWSRKKTNGSFAIYGPEIDLSKIVDRVALSVWFKVDRISSSPVYLGMDCGWPCRAQLDIRKKLRKYPRKEWFNFSIPLNCLSNFGVQDEFDLAKINGPFLLSTEGRLEISIADIRLGLLPEGDEGCPKAEQ